MERLCYPAWFEGLGDEAGLAYRDVFPAKVGRGPLLRARALGLRRALRAQMGLHPTTHTGRPTRAADGPRGARVGRQEGTRPRLPGGGRHDRQHRVRRRLVCMSYLLKSP